MKSEPVRGEQKNFGQEYPKQVNIPAPLFLMWFPIPQPGPLFGLVPEIKVGRFGVSVGGHRACSQSLAMLGLTLITGISIIWLAIV